MGHGKSFEPFPKVSHQPEGQEQGGTKVTILLLELVLGLLQPYIQKSPVTCRKCLCFQREVAGDEDSPNDSFSSSDQSDSESDEEQYLDYLREIYPDQFPSSSSDDDDM